MAAIAKNRGTITGPLPRVGGDRPAAAPDLSETHCAPCRAPRGR